MYPLFDRVVELRVGDTDINGLDIAFEIEKDLTPEPNPCHIEIFNLSQKNREILSRYDKVPVLLKAGYKGHVGVIFQGDMLSCIHEKDGPTWKTTLASGDGALAIQTARINKSFAKGTPVKKVIEEIAKQLGVPADNALNQLKGLMGNLPRGLSICGSAMDELNRMLEPHGYSASVQNNSLQVLKHGESLANRVISLTADSGLKGTPQLGSNNTIQVQAVLIPELLPGNKIHIESVSVSNKLVLIRKVRFFGSDSTAQWETELHGTTI